MVTITCLLFVKHCYDKITKIFISNHGKKKKNILKFLNVTWDFQLRVWRIQQKWKLGIKKEISIFFLFWGVGSNVKAKLTASSIACAK